MLCRRSRLGLERAFDRVGRQPSPGKQAGARRGEERIDESIRVGGFAFCVEQLERRLSVLLAAVGVEVAVDGELRVTDRLERGVPGCGGEGLLAARDRGHGFLRPSSRVPRGRAALVACCGPGRPATASRTSRARSASPASTR